MNCVSSLNYTGLCPGQEAMLAVYMGPSPWQVDIQSLKIYFYSSPTNYKSDSALLFKITLNNFAIENFVTGNC